jgi:hypothetical protein
MVKASVTKSILLVASMAAWLLVGGGLIYLSPTIANNLTHSEMTATWMKTLTRSGYYPKLAIGVSLVMTIVGSILSVIQLGDLKFNDPTIYRKQ